MTSRSLSTSYLLTCKGLSSVEDLFNFLIWDMFQTLGKNKNFLISDMFQTLRKIFELSNTQYVSDTIGVSLSDCPIEPLTPL